MLVGISLGLFQLVIWSLSSFTFIVAFNTKDGDIGARRYLLWRILTTGLAISPIAALAAAYAGRLDIVAGCALGATGGLILGTGSALVASRRAANTHQSAITGPADSKERSRASPKSDVSAAMKDAAQADDAEDAEDEEYDAAGSRPGADTVDKGNDSGHVHLHEDFSAGAWAKCGKRRNLRSVPAWQMSLDEVSSQPFYANRTRTQEWRPHRRLKRVA